jgi:peptidyl-prolyl cis-trans isomerase SurA
MNLTIGRWTRATWLAASVALSMVVGGPADASDIKIIVNNHAITSLDIQSRARLLQLAGHIAANVSTKAAQDELIDNVLQIDDAKRRGLEVTDDIVDKAISDIASRSKLSSQQFAAALSHAGVPIATFRERIRAQIAWARIVKANIAQKMKADQSDLIVQMRNQDKAASGATASDYVLQRIVFALPPTASQAEVDIRTREAEAFRGRFTGCDNTTDLVKNLKNVAVINLGRKLAGEVPPVLRDILSKTDAGKLTPPERSDLGVAMLAVCQKITVTGENAVGTSYDAEEMSKQAEELSKQMTQKLRQSAQITYR